MDTKNIAGLRPATPRATEPVTGPAARSTMIAYGPDPLAVGRGLRGRSPRAQHESARSRSIG